MNERKPHRGSRNSLLRITCRWKDWCLSMLSLGFYAWLKYEVKTSFLLLEVDISFTNYAFGTCNCLKAKIWMYLYTCMKITAGLKCHREINFCMAVVCNAYIMWESMCTGVNYSENVALSDPQNSLRMHWIPTLQNNILLTWFFEFMKLYRAYPVI